jgi:1-deoxy-D-xylulose-5-phosphate reductoisomerase
LFQALPLGYKTGEKPENVERLILTASGGPFLNASMDDLKNVTPEKALKHPTWSMGAKISIDSATMMNKGLEVIEAHHLFQIPLQQIDVLIHPQSIIHSMVCYTDGSYLAQLGSHDMRIPISYALSWPTRIESGASRLNFAELKNLSFYEPNDSQFRCLKLAKEALAQGGVAPAVLNAANEVAVASFLEKQLAFLDIPSVIAECLESSNIETLESLEQVLMVDADTRRLAQKLISKIS